jgi:WD40-like Beta Propeller Repeat
MPRHHLRLGLALTLATAALVGTGTAEARAGGFVTKVNRFTVGQAADWLDRAHVVYHAKAANGEAQIFRATLGGAQRRCLTCGLAGPNQVPVVQPHGRWILFHSWHGHAVKVGSPGFGGLGSDVWVMTRDGRRRTNLTKSGELHDNFHAYWSSDGRYVVWTALNWNTAEGGNGRSDIRVARFDPRGPRLVDEHRVRPANGHWYETQWWAPDGSGFLYTESVDTSLNTELFFCRLPDPARGTCRPRRLTRNPAWDEQAVFTPDMRHVVFMSTRGLPGAFNNWSLLATLLDLPARYDYALILPVFNEAFLQPGFEQANDLYEIDYPRPGRARRLTRLGRQGWIIPEFAWDPSGRRILWTQNKLRDRVDEPSVLRQIRRDVLNHIGHPASPGEVPFDIFEYVRERLVRVLTDPLSYVPPEAQSAPPRLVSQTRIGRFR